MHIRLTSTESLSSRKVKFMHIISFSVHKKHHLAFDHTVESQLSKLQLSERLHCPNTKNPIVACANLDNFHTPSLVNYNTVFYGVQLS